MDRLSPEQRRCIPFFDFLSPEKKRTRSLSPEGEDNVQQKEMDRMREENMKLKAKISQLESHNRTLMKRLHDVKEEESKSSSSLHQEQKFPEMYDRKIRVSLKTRSDSPAIIDGCKWRKYGQNLGKNPWSKAYYRCTMFNGCPVRKHVQEWEEDHSFRLTTYKGHHNHPLPPSAKKISSIVQSAEEMFLSRKMPKDLESFLSSNKATISSADPYPTLMIDMTDLSSSSSSSSSSSALALQRDLQMVKDDAAPQAIQTLVDAITSHPSFEVAFAAAVSSYINGMNKP